ncbi:hypothetical protein RUM44_011939 [Polyplax serrata]|uniref:Uncharacterized protein n=1 Tax=Polyplax serrata TaxID=468196 RepID=A0ABR1BET8_POLSC
MAGCTKKWKRRRDEDIEKHEEEEKEVKEKMGNLQQRVTVNFKPMSTVAEGQEHFSRQSKTPEKKLARYTMEDK